MHSGKIVEYIYINAYHRNPLRRVKAWKIYDGEKYDAEEYAELLLDAAETILTLFGFNRNGFQTQQNISKRKVDGNNRPPLKYFLDKQDNKYLMKKNLYFIELKFIFPFLSKSF